MCLQHSNLNFVGRVESAQAVLEYHTLSLVHEVDLVQAYELWMAQALGLVLHILT